ncbi:MAG TPA: BMP family ABC transporter substrate-binding protein [Tissierellaceae bacterium]|nr:BMP family ABC transporter substrate-binding protein [Tissierellaceae bacterium]
MNKKWLALGLALVLMFTLVACGGSDDGESQSPEPEVEEPEGDDTSSGEDASSGEDFKVTMVTDEGGVNDQSFNQSAHEGLLDLEEDLGVEVEYQESNQVADFEPNFETLLDAESDLIWGVGYKLADAAYEAATNNPDTLYGIVDFSYEDNDDFPEGTPENLVGVLFKDEQSSFLVGYIAGKMTETDQVGFVGGEKGDVIGAFEHGYRAGVAYAAKELDKDIDVLVQYADSFSDSGKGKSIATNMYQQGRDVVFHAAGAVGDGVIEAAKEEDKWVIGVDMDQHHMAPDNVLTSAMKRVDVAIYNVVEELIDGNFPAGETIVYGVEDEGAVDIAPTSDENVPSEILDEVEEIKKEIADGEIEVPSNEEDFEDFLNELE